MTLAISRAHRDRLLALAAAEPDREICGLLLGHGKTVCDVVSAANVAADPSRRFEIDPAVLFRAIRNERAGGPRLAAYYHSHPSGLAEPSPEDARMAHIGPLWLIIAGGDVRAWRFDGQTFTEANLADCV